SEEAINLAERMMAFIDEEAKAASEQLAAERGPFPNWEESIYGPKGQQWPNAQGVRPLRNSTVTTIAPTGTISIIAGASGGVEPLFSLAFMRTVMDKDKLLEVNEIFEEVAKAEGFYSAELMEEIAAAGTLAHIEDVPDWVKRVFVTAHDITPEWHARMQAAFQKHTDNAVSKTVNFPPTATEEEVREVYQLAYDLGCKGVTIYRDGSRSEQPMSTVAKKPEAPAVLPETVPVEAVYTNGNGNGHGDAIGHPLSAIDAEALEADRQLAVDQVQPREVLPRPLPDGDINGWLGRMNSPQGTVRLWVSEVDGQPYEVYVVLGKAGSDLTAFAEGIGRMVSIALRSGIPVEILIDQLRGIGGSRSVGFGQSRVLSVPDAIAKMLQQHYFPQTTPAETPVAASAPIPVAAVAAPKPVRRVAESKPLGDLCPECGNTTLMHIEGCKKCPCGHSEC
ncbi:MAG TPA: response regulator SirA, partial [Chloroflexia bacterium]|nr:response regulator SirA [Chloroflexia bacterium]